MAMIDKAAIERVKNWGSVDVLITHQGPSSVQGDKGFPSLQPLLDRGVASVWLHGHSIKMPEPTRAGRAGSTLVVPLGDIAFRTPLEDPSAGRCEPGSDGWAIVRIGGEDIQVTKSTPPFLNELHRWRWISKGDRLIPPALAGLAWQADRTG